jgi:NAD-dependent deacetylase
MVENPLIVVLTGAGISAESGLATFRAVDGLWEGHDVMEVASPQGWKKNPELVLDFYNQRRKAAREAQPNAAHLALAALEKHACVVVVTQNVDDLHERAGSSNVLHLHGKLFESRSTLDPNLVYPMQSDTLLLGEKCEKGSQLRPNIVWFGETVPMMQEAIFLAAKANAMLIVGTSLNVYPAAGLVDYLPEEAPVILVDPSAPTINYRPNTLYVTENATSGVPKAIRKLCEMLQVKLG